MPGTCAPGATAGCDDAGSADSRPPAPGGWACAATKAPEAAAAAKSGLDSLPSAIGEESAVELGFFNHDELSQASLGTPFCVFMIRLDDLARYHPGEEIKSILVDRWALYPLEVKGAVRSSMIVEPFRGKWQATTFGGAANVAALTATRSNLARQTKRPLQDFFVIQLPALSRWFVAFEEDGALMLLASGRSGAEKDPIETAADLLVQLQPEAERVKKVLDKQVPKKVLDKQGPK